MLGVGSAKTNMDTMHKLSTKYMDTIRQFIKFLLVGVLNTLVGLSIIYSLMYFLGVGPFLSNLLGYAVGIVVSYNLNKIWTFNSSKAARRSFPRFVLVVAVAYIANIFMVYVSVINFRIDPYVSQLIGLAFYTVLVYAGSRKLVFQSA